MGLSRFHEIKDEVAGPVLLNLWLQFLYGFLPALLIMQYTENPSETASKLNGLIPGWDDPKAYIYFFLPLALAVPFYWYLIAKNFYLKKMVGCNLQPIFDFFSELRVVRYVFYNAILDLIKTMRKGYLGYFGVVLYFCAFFGYFSYYGLSFSMLLLFFVYNFYWNYIELRTKKKVKEISQ